MLVLTQLSVGGFAVELAAVASGAAGGIGTILHPALCLGLGWAGLAASVLHLGRPLYAYRAIIGLRHSWLSREVLAFGLYAKLATAFVALDILRPGWLRMSAGLRPALLVGVVLSGLAGLASSVMVYHAVRRDFWHARYGGIKFAGTAIVLGLATALTALAIADVGHLGAVAAALSAATVAKLGFEAWIVRGFATSERTTLRGTASLLRGALRSRAGLRRILGLAGGVVLPAAAVAASSGGMLAMSATAAVLALITSIGGELAERHLFFTAVVRPRMTGGLLP
jgi:DMSO reductase anchor subunit